MTAQLDDLNPYLSGPYAPVHDELIVEDLEVLGELPHDLSGVYVRNGPNPRFPTQGRHHWFDGDGMVHAVRFEQGRASYRNRYVRTLAYERESQAGQGLWHGLMEPAHHNPRDMPIKDTANTDLIYHNGGLLALWYLAGQPYKLDARTLETLGAEDFGGALKLHVSAHAKVDPVTREAFFFDQSFKPPHLSYGVVDARGQLIHAIPIEVPGPRQPHDMAITQRFAILMDLPLFADPEALRAGRYKVAFHRDVPSRFGVIPRHGGPETLRWFEADPCYIYHVVNAWEEGDVVVLTACRVKNPEPDVKGGGTLERMLAFLRLDAQLYQWRFDLRTGQTTEGPLDDDNTEFPTIHAGFTGRPSRYAYNVHLSPAKTLIFDGLIKYDLQTGQRQAHWFGPDRYGSEAPLAMRPGSTREDDGYLVSYVHDAREDRSEVVILDASDLGAGPIARVLLPRRVPLGFHAVWVPEADLSPQPDASTRAGGAP